MSSSVMTRPCSGFERIAGHAHVEQPLAAVDLQASPGPGAAARGRSAPRRGFRRGAARRPRCGWPFSVPGAAPTSRSAAALQTPTTPSLSTPMHAGRHARQRGFDEGATLFEQRVGGGERTVLLAQFRGHLVEGVAEMAEVALGFVGRHLHIEIAARHFVGGADQPADRADEVIGEGEAHPDRGDQQRQREHHEHDARSRARCCGDA